ncbi:ABA4 protein [Xylariales sp. PMI_506]|nr:ABA4 protein [Xylariales sp. PMI_506]
MATQFSGKVIALTGAASGIGLATAHLLASRGAKLSLADVQKDALERAQAEIQAQHQAEVLIFPVDVRKYADVQEWTDATVKHFGRLDGAANLAGVIPKSIGLKGLAEQDFDDWSFVMDVNCTGVMHCLRAQLGAIADDGSIVNASSIAGTTGRANNTAYSASKHAVLGMTRSAAKEAGSRGVRVNAICPGRIFTPMLQKSQEIANNGDASVFQSSQSFPEVALGRMGRAEEVAKLIAFLLSDESSYITGNDISIDGGWRC